MKGLAEVSIESAGLESTMHVDERIAMTRVDEAPVTLAVPAELAYVRLIRLVAASSASDLNYSYDGVEDIRIAADEAANLAISACRSGGAIRVGFFSVDGALAMALECPTAETVVEFDPLASQILAALTSLCTVSVIAGEVRVFFQCFPAAS